MLSSKTKATSITDAFGDFLQLPFKTMLDIGKGTFYAWNQEFLDFIENLFGAPGRAIMNHVEFELKEPHREDIDPKSKAKILLYPRKGDTPFLFSEENLPRDLTDRGYKLFDADMEKFEKAQEANSKLDQRLLTIMKSTTVEQSKRAIRNDPRYQEWLQMDPLECKSSWLYYLMIEATHKTGNFSTKLFRMQQFVTLTQGDRDLEEYHELLNNASKAILHDFGSKDPNHTGYVKLSDFVSAIYLIGVDQTKFHSKIDDVVKDYSDYEELPEPAELMTGFLSYQNNLLISNAPVDTAFTTVTHKKSPKSSRPPPGHVEDPCPTCIYYGRTDIAKRHVLSDCRLNPKSDNHVPAELARANETKAKYLALKAGKSSPTSAATPSPGKTAAAAAATYTKAKSTRATAHAATTDPATAFNAFLASLTPADRDTALSAVICANIPDSDEDA